MLLSAVYFLVVAQSCSEIPEGLMNNPVLLYRQNTYVLIYNTAENKAYASIDIRISLESMLAHFFR